MCIDGANGDVDKLRRAFHPDARVFGHIGSIDTYQPITDFIAFAEAQPGPHKGRPIVGEVEHVLGPASIRRIGMLAFPVFVFESQDGTAEGKVLAKLGRNGWFRVFFGRGRRVELPDGTAWRLVAVGTGGCIVPIVLCERGKLAVAAPHGTRSYGINGRDYAYNLYPQSRAGLRHSTWSLREHDTVLARFRLHSMYADHPVPLAAALLCFTLIKYGVPGEEDLGVPKFRWG